MENGELINQVYLAGTIKKRGEDWVLIDCDTDPKVKAIMCGVEKGDKDSLKKLMTSGEGDYVKLKGHLEAWSKKEGEKWSNGLSVRIDEIKSVQPTYWRDDERIPF